MDKMIDIDLQEASDEQLSRIMKVGEHSPEELTSSEWWRYSKIIMARFGQLEYGYLSTRTKHLIETTGQQWRVISNFLFVNLGIEYSGTQSSRRPTTSSFRNTYPGWKITVGTRNDV